MSFILDMVNVNFASSLTMGVLVGLTKEFQNRGQRLIFLFRGRTELQLLCGWKAPPGKDVSAACAGLAASFRFRA